MYLLKLTLLMCKETEGGTGDVICKNSTHYFVYQLDRDSLLLAFCTTDYCWAMVNDDMLSLGFCSSMFSHRSTQRGLFLMLNMLCSLVHESADCCSSVETRWFQFKSLFLQSCFHKQSGVVNVWSGIKFMMELRLRGRAAQIDGLWARSGKFHLVHESARWVNLVA